MHVTYISPTDPISFLIFRKASSYLWSKTTLSHFFYLGGGGMDIK